MKFIKTFVVFLSLVLFHVPEYRAQTAPFELSLESVEIDQLGGVQSYAIGQSDGKWLLVGGRLDGLHRRQPWASFDLAGHNDRLMVIDPQLGMTWSKDISNLSQSILEQLQSTNMEFIQDEDMLYVIGGYGYSETMNDHTTFPYLAALDIPQVIDAVIADEELSPHIRQFEDELFAVTGGYLHKLYDTFYLVGGQRFEGRYNPMNGPSFVQTYTNSIHRFTLSDDGDDIEIDFLPSWTDTEHLHRRDFNVVAQIMADGEQTLTAFSGVFQQDDDIPFLYPVNIDSAGYTANNEFYQYYNHYHCANVPLYSSDSEEMHTIFFGGISQYYDDSGVLVQDNEVPFVNTIARVSRNAGNEWNEYKLPIEMPGLLGAGAEFIIQPNIAQLANEIIDLDALPLGMNLIGHIFGGISSSEPNIFWVNDGTQSDAHAIMYEVYLNKTATGLDELNPQSNSAIRVQAYPNPFQEKLQLKVFMDKPRDIQVSISDIKGSVIYNRSYRARLFQSGENDLTISFNRLNGFGTYFLTVSAEEQSIYQKLIIHE